MKLKYFKKFITSSTVSIALALAFLTPVAQAQLYDGSKNDACTAVNAANSKGVCDQKKLNDSTNRLNATLGNVINLLSILVGVAAVIMMIIAGFRYVTSGGDSGHISSAKNTFIFALVGLIIAALAQALVKLVLGQV